MGETMRLIHYTDLPARLWANGLGAATDVVSYAPSESESWDWRISIATIAGPSDFSRLPGIDRLLLNAGEGPLRLVRDAALVSVPANGVMPFRGEEKVAALEANRHVLNVMTRRGAASAALSLAQVGGPLELLPQAGEVLALLPLSEGVVVPRSGEPALLRRFDCLVVEDGPLHVDGAGTVVLVRVRAVRSQRS